MSEDFYIGDIGASAFHARLLADYRVGGTPLTRSRFKSRGVQGYLPLATEYGLRTIHLPVLICGNSPRDAAVLKSRLDAALLPDSVELTLPNGMVYTASLESTGEVTEVTQDGRELRCDYTLVGYSHDPLIQENVASGKVFVVNGTAPEMACRLTCTASADAVAYEMCGVIFFGVAAGDVLVLDGLNKRVTRNGVNDFDGCNLITWPTLQPGTCNLTAPDTITVEYYPIWV